MINYYERVKAQPQIFNQLACKELLFVHYNCPVDKPKHEKWSQQNYILYILTGKKIYYANGRSWLMTKGSCVFVRKGACIVEKFYEESLCIMSFFIPDDYLTALTNHDLSSASKNGRNYTDNDLVIPIQMDDMMTSYFESLIPYFYNKAKPSEELLELKFRELLLNVLANPANQKLIDYIRQLNRPLSHKLTQVMEANYLFNLKLEDYAELNNLSLSSFKRHFFAVYKMPPGKWLLGRRLQQASNLLLATDKSIGDIAFETGFEDTTHFSHAFKKHYGESPQRFRAQHNVDAPTPNVTF